MEETEVVDVRTRILTVADHGLLVEVVVGRREYEADDQDHKRPSLVEREDKVSNLDPLTAPKYQIVQETKLCCIPEGEEWRCVFLEKLTFQRSQHEREGADVAHIQRWIDSLCTT